MDTGRLWNPISKKHADGTKPAAGPSGRAYSALPLDWDGDGDLDLIVGNDRGGLFLRPCVRIRASMPWWQWLTLAYTCWWLPLCPAAIV